jgi:hypothetical protein
MSVAPIAFSHSNSALEAMQANGAGMPISPYDARPSSFASSQGAGSQMMYAPPQPNPMATYRSFSDVGGHAQQQQMNSQPQIYTVLAPLSWVLVQTR